jgi:hypothetical protein
MTLVYDYDMTNNVYTLIQDLYKPRFKPSMKVILGVI